MEWLTVATFNEPEHAALALRRLQEAGIKAALYDERALQRRFFLSPALAGIRLRVLKENQPAARQLLERWHATDGVLRHAIICPECGSSRIEYPQFSRHFLWGGVAAIFAVLRCFQRKFFCKSCHYTWPASVKLEPKTDALGWPEKQHQHR